MILLYDFDVKEAESSKEGNGWLGPALKGLKRSSPTALKIALRSVRIF
jgi:3-hydroxyisobutyryl-CoA hydrolase